MPEALFTLAIITAIAFVGPFAARLIPGQWIQPGALVLILGWLCGPHMLGLVNPTAQGIPLLKQLGLAFMFLMGGYELTPRDVTGPVGRHAAASWLVSFALALAVTFALSFDFSWRSAVAFAIALTSTSFSKVAAVLKSRREFATPLGKVVTSYGACGELLPVAAVALLIGEHSPWFEAAVIGAFCLLAWLGVTVARHEDRAKTRLAAYVHDGENASQLMLQLAVAILVALVALGAILGADMIVAGFAAGFVLRQLVPEGDERTLSKLTALSDGFFVPVVFVLSGAGIDVLGGLAHPAVVLGFIALLVLVRGVPVDVTMRLFPQTRGFNRLERWDVVAYSCMALATVVAMTDIAAESGDMSEAMAGTLVFAAALTTVVVPVITRVLEQRDKRIRARS